MASPPICSPFSPLFSTGIPKRAPHGFRACCRFVSGFFFFSFFPVTPPWTPLKGLQTDAMTFFVILFPVFSPPPLFWDLTELSHPLFDFGGPGVRSTPFILHFSSRLGWRRDVVVQHWTPPFFFSTAYQHRGFPELGSVRRGFFCFLYVLIGVWDLIPNTLLVFFFL